MNNNQLINYEGLQNADTKQIIKLFDDSVEALRASSTQLRDAKRTCDKADREVAAAKACDFKNDFWFDDTTKAVEYLQEACLALAKSQISTKKALECLFQYQIISNNMITAMMQACLKNRMNLNALQSRVNEYLQYSDVENEEVTATLLDLYDKLEDNKYKIDEIESLKNTIEIQQIEINKLQNNQSAQPVQPVQPTQPVQIIEVPQNNNTITIVLAVVAIIVGIAAMSGLKF